MSNAIHNYNLRNSENDVFIPRTIGEALKKSFAFCQAGGGGGGWGGGGVGNSLSPGAKQATRPYLLFKTLHHNLLSISLVIN